MNFATRPRLHRADANQKRLVAFIQSIPGATWLPINGVIDGCVGYSSTNFLVEFKASKRSKLTASQRALIAQWNGDPIRRIETESDILRMLGL